MRDLAAQHVGDGLHSAVRVPWEPVHIGVGIIGTKIVEEQERIVLLRWTEANRPMEMDAGPFNSGTTLEHLAYTSGVWHECLLSRRSTANPVWSK
jgi:hypothetical protein